MPGKREDEGVLAERKLRIERQRWQFRIAVLAFLVIIGMYFIVAPVAASAGHPLDLPPFQILAVALAILSAPAFGVDGGKLFGSLGTFLANLNKVAGAVTAALAATTKPEEPGEKDDGDHE